MSYARLLGEWLALLAGVSLFVVMAVSANWTQRLDATLLDHQSSLRLDDPSDRVVIVEIDDRSLGTLGNWPWDRRRHAELLDRLREYEPDVVLYDVLFLEASDGPSDIRFAEAIATSGNVVLAHHFGPMQNSNDGSVPVLPYAPFLKASEGIGHVAVLPDEDGVVRRFSLSLEADGRQWPHLAIAALDETFTDAEIARLTGASPIVPMHENGAFRTVAAGDVIAGTTPKEYFAGKIVLVGATAQGLGDRYSVAEHAGRLMPGVEIQANLVSSLLNGDTIRPVATAIIQLFQVLVALAVCMAWWKLSPSVSLRATGIAILGMLSASVLLLVLAGYWLPVSSAILALLIAYPIWGWRRLSAVSRYLEKEAQQFSPLMAAQPAAAEGFDRIAKQVSRISFLLSETRDRLSFLARVIETSPDAMLVFDEEGELVLLNQQAEELFGSQAENKGSFLPELLHETNAKLCHETGEITFVDGRIFLVAKSEESQLQRWEIIALRDVTAIRESERDRAAMLEFLSHDMRSPQAAIIGLSTGKGGLKSESERFQRIEAQARRTLKLTDDFVQIARLEHNGIKPLETDIGALLYEALDRAYPEARRKSISVISDIPAEPEFCHVDPLAISRAIDNLIGNAIKFSNERSSVTLSLVRETNEEILISVMDEGPGLPPERMESPWARFGASDTQAGPSAGLGLAYVKRVVDEHGGEIVVRSVAEIGTTFTLRIPCDRACRN